VPSPRSLPPPQSAAVGEVARQHLGKKGKQVTKNRVVKKAVFKKVETNNKGFSK